MGQFKIYDISISRELIAEERNRMYLAKSPQEKLNELMSLTSLSISLNGGRPLKEPQGKGIIIRKPVK